MELAVGISTDVASMKKKSEHIIMDPTAFLKKTRISVTLILL